MKFGSLLQYFLYKSEKQYSKVIFSTKKLQNNLSYGLDEWFSTGFPWNPRVPPAQSRSSARNYKML